MFPDKDNDSKEVKSPSSVGIVPAKLLPSTTDNQNRFESNYTFRNSILMYTTRMHAYIG